METVKFEWTWFLNWPKLFARQSCSNARGDREDGDARIFDMRIKKNKKLLYMFIFILMMCHCLGDDDIE